MSFYSSLWNHLFGATAPPWQFNCRYVPPPPWTRKADKTDLFNSPLPLTNMSVLELKCAVIHCMIRFCVLCPPHICEIIGIIEFESQAARALYMEMSSSISSMENQSVMNSLPGCSFCLNSCWFINGWNCTKNYSCGHLYPHQENAFLPTTHWHPLSPGQKDTL